MRLALLCMAVAATANVGAAPGAGATQALTPEKALSFVRIADLQFSPDATQLAYVASSYSWDALSRLRIVEVATGAERAVTPEGKSERLPQWAPDGKTLAFLSNRGGRSQVYLLSVAGGDATPLTASKQGVTRFHWSPDGRQIAYLAPEDGAEGSGGGPQVADAPGGLARLWLVDVTSHITRVLGPSGYRIDEFQWSGPEKLLLAASDSPRVEEFTDKVYSLALNDGVVREVARPPQPFDLLLSSPDKTQFAVRSTGANGPTARDLFVGELAGGSPRSLTAALGVPLAEIKWREQRRIWVRAVDGFHNRIFILRPGQAAARVELPYSVASFDIARDGQLAFVGEDFQHLPEIYLRSKNGAVRQLTHVHQGWEAVTLAPVEIFRTITADGVAVEAALMQPGARPEGKLPLVLLVHGGPASNFTAGYGWLTAWAQLLAAHGYQVLMVNPRGSNGYSEDFVKANRADWGGGDYRDLMSVLDAVIARGTTDPARLGVGGWSYGGEMSAWAITQTPRFKAAVVGAGVYDQQAEFETEEDPAGDEWYFGTPWEHPEVFARNSPSTYIGKARTPTLILGGDADITNPVGQSKGLYRALKHLGVETEMVLYPGEGHSPRRRISNVDMFGRILEWYDRHLK